MRPATRVGSRPASGVRGRRAGGRRTARGLHGPAADADAHPDRERHRDADRRRCSAHRHPVPVDGRDGIPRAAAARRREGGRRRHQRRGRRQRQAGRAAQRRLGRRDDADRRGVARPIWSRRAQTSSSGRRRPCSSQRLLTAAAAARVPLISPAATYPQLSTLDTQDVFFRTIPVDGAPGRRARVRCCRRKKQLKVALVASSDPIGQSIVPTLRTTPSRRTGAPSSPTSR